MAPKFLRSLEHWMNKVIHPSRPHKISRRERKNFSFLSTFLCPCLVFVSSKQRDKVLATRRALIGWNSMVYQSTGAQQARVNCKCKIFASVFLRMWPKSNFTHGSNKRPVHGLFFFYSRRGLLEAIVDEKSGRRSNFILEKRTLIINVQNRCVISRGSVFVNNNNDHHHHCNNNNNNNW